MSREPNSPVALYPSKPTLTFTGRGAAAAEFLYMRTSLHFSPVVFPHVDDVGCFTGATINQQVRPSSGEEQVLLPLLWAFSTASHRMPPPLFFTAVDELTRDICWQAVGIALGCISGAWDTERAS